MAKQCNLYLTTREGQQLLATFTLSGTEISAKAVSGRVNLKSILDETHFVNGRNTTRQEDPVGWFNALPTHYHGAYLQAQMVS